jgi:metallophosphoesterase (TIGR00282 family)
MGKMESNKLKIVFCGDVVGKPGRSALAGLLPAIVEEHSPDLVIANGENAAGGYGISRGVFAELCELGVDVVTSGNHIWSMAETGELLEQEPNLLRPANYPPTAPGRGFGIFHTQKGMPVGVVNLSGRVEMSPMDCPFRCFDDIWEELRGITPIIIVDFHAEATSEKQALAMYADGRASAVLGTHTHVPTADARITAKGTAVITDVGMCGVVEGAIIGNDAEEALEKFLTGVSRRIKPARGIPELMGALLSVDAVSGRACAIEPLRRRMESMPNTNDS